MIAANTAGGAFVAKATQTYACFQVVARRDAPQGPTHDECASPLTLRLRAGSNVTLNLIPTRRGSHLGFASAASASAGSSAELRSAAPPRRVGRRCMRAAGGARLRTAPRLPLHQYTAA
jgi:hypothetical protein